VNILNIRFHPPVRVPGQSGHRDQAIAGPGLEITAHEGFVVLVSDGQTLMVPMSRVLDMVVDSAPKKGKKNG
jgi:hypothetical protein